MQNPVLNCKSIQLIAGDVLPDGRVMDLICEGPGEAPRIVVYDGSEVTPYSATAGEPVCYIPRALPGAYQRAVRLPRDCSPFGTSLTLIKGLQGAFRGFFTSHSQLTAVIAFWLLSSWVPECFWSPPMLVVVGPIGRVQELFRILNALCRRGILLAAPSYSLPTEFQVTPMWLASNVSRKNSSAWLADNFHGLYLPRKRGELQQLACPRAVYDPSANIEDVWNENTFFVSVPDLAKQTCLNSTAIETLAEQFQPQLQLFRLHRLYELAKQQNPRVIVRYPTPIALAGLMAGEEEAASMVVAFTKRGQDVAAHRKSVDVDAVIAEVLWPRAHKQEAIQVNEICERVNTVLRARGETLEYNVKEIGWKLKDLALPTQRIGAGKILKFPGQIRKRIHDLADELGLDMTKMNECSECGSNEV